MACFPNNYKSFTEYTIEAMKIVFLALFSNNKMSLILVFCGIYIYFDKHLLSFVVNLDIFKR